jgi:hypothetical protein
MKIGEFVDHWISSCMSHICIFSVGSNDPTSSVCGAIKHKYVHRVPIFEV